MILYSIIPSEVVFSNPEKTFVEKVILDWLGEKVEVLPIGENKFVINRVLSTSPKAFLNPGLQPGTVIEGKLYSSA